MFGTICAVVLAAAVSTCNAAETALRDAQTAWQAFKNGDFVDVLVGAEGEVLGTLTIASSGTAAR